MVKEIEGIVNPPAREWDRYTQNCLETNRLGNIPDGEYRVVDEFMCNNERNYHGIERKDWQEGDPPCQYVYSDTLVTVRSGMFDLSQLLAAANELKEKTHYWGDFLEHVQFVRRPRGASPSTHDACRDFSFREFTRPDGTVRPAWTRIKCKRHKHNEMTEEEKQMWAEGLIYIAWGS